MKRTKAQGHMLVLLLTTKIVQSKVTYTTAVWDNILDVNFMHKENYHLCLPF